MCSSDLDLVEALLRDHLAFSPLRRLRLLLLLLVLFLLCRFRRLRLALVYNLILLLLLVLCHVRPYPLAARLRP